MATIAIIGTLDSKAEEHSFVADQIRKAGHSVALIDVGTGGEPQVAPDFTRHDVAVATGLDLDSLIARHDRGECVVAMSECAEIGRILAKKANANPAPVAILNPLKAVSEINGAGQPFYDPEADQALFDALHKNADVEVIDFQETINSSTFAEACAKKLLELIQRSL